METPVILFLCVVGSVLDISRGTGHRSSGLVILTGLCWLIVLLVAVFAHSQIGAGGAILALNGMAVLIADSYRPRPRRQEPLPAGPVATALVFLAVVGLIIFFGIIDFNWFGAEEAVGSVLNVFSQGPLALATVALALVWLPLFIIAHRLGKRGGLQFLWPSLACLVAWIGLCLEHIV